MPGVCVEAELEARLVVAEALAAAVNAYPLVFAREDLAQALRDLADLLEARQAPQPKPRRPRLRLVT
jgi:hypothetical protein